VSLRGDHIVVRLPSVCRSCRSYNTKTSKSRRQSSHYNWFINL